MTDAVRSRRGLFPTWPVVALVGVMIALVLLGSSHIDPPESGERAIDALGVGCGVVGALSVLLWRTSAVAMVVIAAAGMFVYTALGYQGGPALMSGPVVLVFLGYVGPRRMAWAGAGLVIVAVTVGRRFGGQSIGAGELLVVGWALAAVLGGQAIRAAGDRRAAEREQQDRLRHQAVIDERLRIAQDLHDSVAHAMATINVQSGVAAHLIDRRPEQARHALEAIRTASSDVLDELGAIVGVLRDTDEPAPRAPAGGLDDIEALVSRACADGLAVTCTRSTGSRTVPHSVGAAAYRVVQEALTNVRRHAGAEPRAIVTVSVGASALVVAVVDDGGTRPTTAPNPPTSPSPGPGFGLVGMRERVEATGGGLRTGPTPSGGFEVHAEWEMAR